MASVEKRRNALGNSVVVIGAGIAGMSAAYDLQSAGYKVTVLESGNFVGGRMADQDINGINVHTGASVIFSFNKAMFNLIEELGISDDLYSFPDKNEGYNVEHGNETYKLKLTFDPIFLLTHPAFGFKTKAKLAALLPDMIKSGLQTDPCMMHTAAHLDDENVTDYITRKVSEEFLEKYVEPYFRAPWHWEPEQISRAYLLSLLGHIVGGKLLSFKTGIGHLSRTLGDRLDVKLNTKVVESECDDSGCRLLVEHDGTIETVECDFVVCAIPGTLVNRVVKSVSDTDRAFFDTVRYNRGARIYYAVDGVQLQPRDTWFTRNSPCKFSLFYAMPTDSLVPEGFKQPQYLQCELSPQLSEAIEAEGGQGRLDSYARDELERLCPEAAGNVTAVAEQWWDNMLTEWYPGYTKGMAVFLKKQDETPSRIYFCGDYLSQSHTGGACASGRRAAETLRNHWE